MTNADDKWFIQILDGTATELEGQISLDTAGGVVTFHDANEELVGFFNLGAVAFGERVDEDDEESEEL